MITITTAPEGKMYRKGDIFAKALQLCEGDTIDNYTLVDVEEYEEWKNKELEIYPFEENIEIGTKSL